MHKRAIDPTNLSPISRAFFSIDDAALALGIGRTLTYRFIKEGKLKVVKMGRRTLVPATEFDAFPLRLQGIAV